jgi:cobalt-zinc-cadmium resistance protein CzcA
LPVFYVLFSQRSFRLKPNVMLVLMLLAGFSTTQAQNLNREDALKMALDSNLTVRASGLQVDLNRVLKGAAVDIEKTSIEGQYGQFNSATKDNGLTVSQTFAFPTVYLRQRQLADTKIKSSEWQRKASQLEIATQVKQAYSQLTYLHALKTLLLEQERLFDGFQKAADVRTLKGETGSLEKMTARSQAQETQNRSRQVSADIAVYERKLRTLLNTSRPVSIADTVLTQLSFTPSAEALAQHPSLAMAKQEVAVAATEKKLERSRMMPDLSIGYFSQTIDGTMDANGVAFRNGYRFSGVQAGIAIPLWAGPHLARIKAAGISENLARTNAEQFGKLLTSNYEELLEQYATLKRSVEFYEQQAVPEALMIVEQSTIQYKAGSLNYLDYVMSLSRASDIRKNHLEALNSLNQTIIQLQYITGQLY